jgi:hypothetical protein
MFVPAQTLQHLTSIGVEYYRGAEILNRGRAALVTATIDGIFATCTKWCDSVDVRSIENARRFHATRAQFIIVVEMKRSACYRAI